MNGSVARHGPGQPGESACSPGPGATFPKSRKRPQGLVNRDRNQFLGRSPFEHTLDLIDSVIDKTPTEIVFKHSLPNRLQGQWTELDF